jgi:hypothetical protein
MSGGHRGAIVPEVLYRYRRRSDSMSRVMNESDTWFRLYGELIDKHPAPFASNLLDLVLRREWALGCVALGLDRAREELATALEPALVERTRERDRARERLQQHNTNAEQVALRLRVDEAEAARQRADLARQHAEAERQRAESDARAAYALRDELYRSWSWRITAPLRRLYEWCGLAPRTPLSRGHD